VASNHDVQATDFIGSDQKNAPAIQDLLNGERTKTESISQ